MDPDGSFQGNTLSVWWKPVQMASRYLVTIEQCNSTTQCRTVIDLPVNETSMEMTSAEKFGPCTFYTLKVRIRYTC